MNIYLKTRYAYCPNAFVRWAQYGNGNIAIRLMLPSGAPLMTATVNPSVPLALDEVAVKNWSENEGAEESLIRAGVIEGAPVRTMNLNHVKINIYKLTPDALADLELYRMSAKI